MVYSPAIPAGEATASPPTRGPAGPCHGAPHRQPRSLPAPAMLSSSLAPLQQSFFIHLDSIYDSYSPGETGPCGKEGQHPNLGVTLAGVMTDTSQSTSSDTQGVARWGLAEDPQLHSLTHFLCIFLGVQSIHWLC